jgi:hypothetical protein
MNMKHRNPNLLRELRIKERDFSRLGVILLDRPLLHICVAAEKKLPGYDTIVSSPSQSIHSSISRREDMYV